MKPPIGIPEDLSFLSLFLGIAAIFVFLFAFRQMKRISWLKKSAVDRLNRLQPLLELIGMLIILFWAVWILFKGQKIYLTVIISLLSGGVLWSIRFFFSDLVAGIILRTENLFESGDSIMVEDQQAIIRAVGFRCLSVVKADGTTIQIPYSHLARSPLVKPTAHTAAKSHSFEFTMEKDSGIMEMFDRIKNAVLNSAWSIPNLTPGVELLHEGETECKFKVTVYALKNEHFAEIERNVVQGNY